MGDLQSCDPHNMDWLCSLLTRLLVSEIRSDRMARFCFLWEASLHTHFRNQSAGHLEAEWSLLHFSLNHVGVLYVRRREFQMMVSSILMRLCFFACFFGIYCNSKYWRVSEEVHLLDLHQGSMSSVSLQWQHDYEWMNVWILLETGFIWLLFQNIWSTVS